MFVKGLKIILTGLGEIKEQSSFGFFVDMNKLFEKLIYSKLSKKFDIRYQEKFDLLKKEKIVEHHNRIQAILNLAEDGFLILDSKGAIVYINDLLLNVFPPFQEKKSIIDSNFNPEIENNIKKYAISVIKSGSKQPSQNNFFPSLKKHITLKSAVVRNSFGVVCGAVIALSNLPKSDEKRKDDKKQEQEENN